MDRIKGAQTTDSAPVLHSTDAQTITATAAQWRSVKSCDTKLHSLRGSYSTPDYEPLDGRTKPPAATLRRQGHRTPRHGATGACRPVLPDGLGRPALKAGIGTTRIAPWTCGDRRGAATLIFHFHSGAKVKYKVTKSGGSVTGTVVKDS
ncbi:hypothetical protein [Streptomyces sp. NBC_00847]|uniref:hypothetical protein n=1 Tax=Streptomyces sp. NBC_00847 TaxID=2975850 RepID=UPI002255DC48|nr:hypothetical protein [Streptomyces sp. NBC_00847]MCX4879084.1 hypothetical protein [Streptomyces sp. NBC_00847]